MNGDWTPQSAEEVAKEEGIALGEKHWCVITSSRELTARNGRAPSIAQVSAACHVSVQEVRNLFPGDAEAILAHIAGAPEFERKPS